MTTHRRSPDGGADDARAVALPDGRILEFADYGDPRGLPVVAHHGTHDSHSLWRVVHDDCRAAGVRLIVPDRPGYGGSTPAPDRRVIDWPADLLTLVDALGLETVAVLSLREGVAYATAAAAILPERIDRAALVASRRPRRAHDAPLDAWLARRPWGFDLETITTPTSLWFGRHDDRRAAATLRWLQARLPHATTVYDPGLGSYSLLTRAPDILEYLIKTAD